MCAIAEPYGFICRFLVQTGLLWGEAVRAQISDIENDALVVHKKKSGKVRRVPLAPGLRAELRGRVGRIIGFKSEGSFARMVPTVSGVDWVHPHQLRHTFVVTASVTGHSSTRR